MNADGMTQRQIDDVMGVHQKTVWNDLRVDEKASGANGEEVDFDEMASIGRTTSMPGVPDRSSLRHHLRFCSGE
jgi:hypothetical protein